jgi:hypothetical protein
MHINNPFARTALADAVAVNPVDDKLAEQVRQEMVAAMQASFASFKESFLWGPDGPPAGTGCTGTATISNIDLAELEKFALNIEYVPSNPDYSDRLSWRSQWLFEQCLGIRKPDPRAVIVVNPTT